MIHQRLLPAVLLLSACAAVPEQDEERPSRVAKDPARIHEFFIRKIREREEAVAAQVTTLDPNAFTMGVRNRVAPDLTRRILLGFEQHELKVEGKEAVARWCNREFGISRDFRMVLDPQIKIWMLVITREQIEELATAGLAWFRKQREAAEGRIYVYPPDWIAANVSPTCKCGR